MIEQKDGVEKENCDISVISQKSRSYSESMKRLLAGKTMQQSLSASSVNVDTASGQQNGNHDYEEEQVVDAQVIQEFMIKEAKAEKLALCFGCHQPGTHPTELSGGNESVWSTEEAIPPVL